ncbi:MAG: hypothetical protein WBZ32_03960 [Candidatus Acidiferrales bacterium]
MNTRTVALLAAAMVAIVCTAAAPPVLAQSNAAPAPAAAAAATALPHDQHDGLTISADPYTQSARAKDKFGKANPLPAGILPIEVFLRNDSAQPIHIGLDTIQLEIHDRDGRMQGIDALGPVDAAFLIVHPAGSAEPKARRFPIGVPGGSGDKKVDKLADVLRPLSLQGDIVPPMATIHGFLYFNMSHQMALINRGSLYVPDASQALSKQPLIFFEVPLGNGEDAPAEP